MHLQAMLIDYLMFWMFFFGLSSAGVFLMDTLFQAIISKDKCKRIDFSSVSCMTNLQYQSYNYNVQYVNAAFPRCFPSLCLKKCLSV